jgi:hypothetical protein
MLKTQLMKKIIHLFTAIILLTASACKKQTVQPSIEQRLAGKWKFESTILGLTGTKYVAVPSQVDVIEFNTDHSFVRTTNNEFTGKGTYNITQGKSIFTQKDDNILTYNPQQGQPSVISIITDTLRLSENVYDGNSITYSRVK